MPLRLRGRGLDAPSHGRRPPSSSWTAQRGFILSASNAPSIDIAIPGCSPDNQVSNGNSNPGASCNSVPQELLVDVLTDTGFEVDEAQEVVAQPGSDCPALWLHAKPSSEVRSGLISEEGDQRAPFRTR